jgi:asparagine synthase (glutamine-hydrolysing)
MCGIGAILRTDGKRIPKRWIDQIDARIAGRGPDGEGRFHDRVEAQTTGGRRTIDVALVHRRLAVIDPAGGAQPMVSPRGRGDDEGLVALVFNGCIYNHRELRRELEAAGHRFQTDHSDAEVLVHGYREWGPELQSHLEGMYAYVIWDRRRASLTLGRDWFGEKPLYHRMDVGDDGVRLLVASSDATAVATVPPDAPRVDDAELAQRVREYLQVGYAWGGHTVAAPGVAIRNVEPSGPFHGQPSWPGADPGTPSEPSEQEIEGLLEQAVARRLEADVPLGCFLSGGVDSSLVAALAVRERPDLATFTVRMPGAQYDESARARRVAEHLGTRHTTLSVAADPASDLVMLVGLLGQPFADSSILPTYWVSRAAREHVTVALSGDGGDELFVGYERYLAARLLSRHRRVLGSIPPWLGRSSHPRGRLHKVHRLGQMAREAEELGVLAIESIFTQAQIAGLMGPRADRSAPLAVPAGDDALESLRRCDLVRYLPDDLLCKVDTASMAVALEVRCPYLDRDLARALLSMRVGSLVPGGRRKGLLRRIARRHLPPGAADRPKMGFAIPIGQWLRTNYGGLRTLLLDHLHSAEPFGPVRLERRAVRALIDEHLEGHCDHGHRLFALLTLSIWARSLTPSPAHVVAAGRP